MEQKITIDNSPIIKDSMNIADIKNIILIDQTIENKQIFFSSNNNETLPIYYNYYTDRDKLFEYLEKEFINIDRIAFIFDNSMMHNKYFLNNELFFTENDIFKFENNKDCLLDNYSSNVSFLIKTCKKFNVKNIDFLACNSLEYINWQKYYEILNYYLGGIIGASTDLTGNIKYGGNWIMENTKEDIQNIYFNENITNYSSTLFSSSISYINTFFYGRSAFLFVIQTTNNFSNLVLNNFTNIVFNNNANASQRIYNVYYREKNNGQFLLVNDVTNLNINLLPNKDYEIILSFANYIFDSAYYSYYSYGPQTIPITQVLASTDQLVMFPSSSGFFIYSTFNPNDITTYNILKTGAIRNQSLTLNYSYKLTPTLSISPLPQATYGDLPLTTNTSSNSDAPIILTSSDTSVATINGNTIILVGPGNSMITASQAATINYTAASVSTPLTVNQVTPSNPVIIISGEGLVYLLDTTATYADITTDIVITEDLVAEAPKVLFTSDTDGVVLTKNN
jgi:hypothetical protein